MSASIYAIPLRRIDGSATSVGDYQGKVLLIVNVASKCGLTPQYEGLEKLYEQYQARGLAVLGFPSNEFAGQEPGSEAEIQSFCRSTYGVKFPMFSKIHVNGQERHPLYATMIQARPQATASGNPKLRDTLGQHGLLPKHDTDVMWNFEKFLIGRDGTVIARFAPDIEPGDARIVGAIESALKAH